MTATLWHTPPSAINYVIDCTGRGVGRCGGACCRYTYWPGIAKPTADGFCHYHTPDGCRLTIEQRPLVCLLYPLRLVPNKRYGPGGGTFVVHFRSRVNGCRPNVGRGGVRIINLFAPVFTHIFGRHGFVAAMAGKKVPVPEHIARQYAEEARMAAAGILPPPRNG